MGVQIQISKELWKHLNREKEQGEALNDVIVRLLKFEKGGKTK